MIQDCAFKDNYTASPIPGWVGRGPTVRPGVELRRGLRPNGINGLYTSYGRISGGAMGFGMNSNVRVIRSSFTGNKAYR